MVPVDIHIESTRTTVVAGTFTVAVRIGYQSAATFVYEIYQNQGVDRRNDSVIVNVEWISQIRIAFAVTRGSGAGSRNEKNRVRNTNLGRS